jgi:CheY-like chemotaxis protein
MEEPTNNGGFDIVVVDSDPARRRHYIDNVAPRTDHRFTYVDSGEEFLRRLEAGLRPLPRILLIALTLPGMPGDELVRRIRGSHPDLDESPAIVVTGGDRHDPAKRAAERAGANIWLGEPVTAWAMDAALHEFAPGRFVIRWVDRNPPTVDGVIQAG